MPDLSVEIVAKEEIFHRAIFEWFNLKFYYDRYDGSKAGPIDRLVLDWGDSVGMLMHDVKSDEIILVEQVRAPTIAVGNGWILELPAGKVGRGEKPIETAKRETEEETGAEAAEIRLISSFFLSPGISTEQLHLFYCPFPDGLKVAETAGLAEESEDIRVHRVTVSHALEMIESGKIIDAKTILALYWLNQKS